MRRLFIAIVFSIAVAVPVIAQDDDSDGGLQRGGAVELSASATVTDIEMNVEVDGEMGMVVYVQPDVEALDQQFDVAIVLLWGDPDDDNAPLIQTAEGDRLWYVFAFKWSEDELGPSLTWYEYPHDVFDAVTLLDSTIEGPVEELILTYLVFFPYSLFEADSEGRSGFATAAIRPTDSDEDWELISEEVTFQLPDSFDEAVLIAAGSPTCTLTNAGSGGINLRGGPGTNFDVVSVAAAGEQVTAVGQAEVDGYIWWWLDDSSWVRSDVIGSGADCAELPVVDGDNPQLPETEAGLVVTTDEPQTFGVDLAQIYAAPGNEHFNFNYPADWHVVNAESDGVVMAADGWLIVQVNDMNDVDGPVEEVLNGYANAMLDNHPDAHFDGTLTFFEAGPGERAGGMFQFTQPEAEADRDTQYLVGIIPLPDAGYGAVIMTRPVEFYDDSDNWVMMAILASFGYATEPTETVEGTGSASTFTAMPLDETPIFDGQFVIQYPAGWEIDQQESMVIFQGRNHNDDLMVLSVRIIDHEDTSDSTLPVTEVAPIFLTSLQNQYAGAEFNGDPAYVTLADGREGALITFVDIQEDSRGFHQYGIVQLASHRYGWVHMIILERNYDDSLTSLLQQVLASFKAPTSSDAGYEIVEIPDIDLPELWLAEDEAFSFRHPANMEKHLENPDGSIVFASRGLSVTLVVYSWDTVSEHLDNPDGIEDALEQMQEAPIMLNMLSEYPDEEPLYFELSDGRKIGMVPVLFGARMPDRDGSPELFAVIESADGRYGAANISFSADREEMDLLIAILASFGSGE